MSLMTAIEVAASGLSAQRRRLEVLLSNLANANTTGKEPYRRKDVIFTATNLGTSFGAEFDAAVQGVAITGVVADSSEPRKRSEPGHRFADEKGMVSYPNIEPLTEMANVLDATRSYEANLQAVNMAKEMLQKTLEMLK
jgi:flagellar basal-body rod protein FlgC